VADIHRPGYPVRFVTAASLFDGHDAAINIIRRLLQAQGAEVIHLGHNRAVDEVVTAAIQEDVAGVAVSSYQGGHLEYFKYLIDRLAEAGRPDMKVFGGGGGTITAGEAEELEAYGVTKIFSPRDGQELGLEAMVNMLVTECDLPPRGFDTWEVDRVASGDHSALARLLSAAENDKLGAGVSEQVGQLASGNRAPVLAITGPGGSGKSSLTDELVNRFRLDQADRLRIAVLAVDPSRRRGGGALLGDRIRMNSIRPDDLYGGRLFFRSFAARGARGGIPPSLDLAIASCRAAGHDLIVVETPGMGQGDSDIVDHSDLPLYVMTPDYGAPSQLEKIDMLEHAGAVAINKFDRRGSEDALRDVRRQLSRNPAHAGIKPGDLPVFGTVASRFADGGVTDLYRHLRDRLAVLGLPVDRDGGVLDRDTGVQGPDTGVQGPDTGVQGPDTGVQGPDLAVRERAQAVVPPSRVRYLAEITETIRAYHLRTRAQVEAVRRLGHLEAVSAMLAETGGSHADIGRLRAEAEGAVSPDSVELIRRWPGIAASRRAASRMRESQSGVFFPRVAVPRDLDDGALLRWLRSENVPGEFPYTAGVFAFKRDDEDPTRMFAGEGDAMRTNRRFHLLADGQGSTRLSTAFDSVTLYGFDPDPRPDIYGKVGNSGVSIATLDDVKALFAGFDLCDPGTSVSMTINGPAPTILAMYFNAAVDDQLERFESSHGRAPNPGEAARIRSDTLSRIRGTVQADILKEDQGQNTCIFSTDFSLRVMADVQEWFIANRVRNFYSVSVSGYHIAEAGANPISQLAFTLANGFTYVEAYLARGMDVDDFAPNFSFFFSNGMDPEYTVIGRVARRIWAIAMRDRYGADARSQRLKYHVQTSGRSLHAQEIGFNDIRTTLQALCAIYDNANSLHTNAYDEALTTPTPESVRRALAIQMIINREWGLASNENPLQGSFVVEELTELVEEAVLAELDRISERGGVLGAMETGYQRGRIQDESMLYESRKHDGSLPLVGVNTFIDPAGETSQARVELQRSTEAEKQSQLRRLDAFKRAHDGEREVALDDLRRAALEGDNVFESLMTAVRCASLGEITSALFDVGGRFRRSM
jgi:methylmalonyl-CoA mutase